MPLLEPQPPVGRQWQLQRAAVCWCMPLHQVASSIHTGVVSSRMQSTTRVIARHTFNVAQHCPSDVAKCQAPAMLLGLQLTTAPLLMASDLYCMHLGHSQAPLWTVTSATPRSLTSTSTAMPDCRCFGSVRPYLLQCSVFCTRLVSCLVLYMSSSSSCMNILCCNATCLNTIKQQLA